MPVLVEQYVVVGDTKDREQAAELWRFGPKAFQTYYNIRDPKEIQQRADTEIPLEKVYGDWPVGTDPAVHIKTVPSFSTVECGSSIFIRARQIKSE